MSPWFDPPEPKPEECGMWATDVHRNFISVRMGDVTTDVNPRSTEPLGKSALETEFEIITETGIPACHAPGSVPQTEPAGGGGSYIWKKSFYQTESCDFKHVMPNPDTALGQHYTEHSHEFILISNEDPSVIESAVYLSEVKKENIDIEIHSPCLPLLANTSRPHRGPPPLILETTVLK